GEGRQYLDAPKVGRTWRTVHADGSPDLSAPGNTELPIFRFGRLGLEVGSTRVDLLMTNPEVPEFFKRQFFGLAGAPAECPRPAPDPVVGGRRAGPAGLGQRSLARL